MSLGETTNRIYLNVGFGRLRKKCDKDTPGAVERSKKDGTKLYALEYKFVSGALEDIRFKDDEQYGKSWTVFLKDGDEHYAIQVNEESRFCADLLKRIPNMVKLQRYIITPYDFESNGKRKAGLSIKDAAENNVESYYEKFTKKEDGTWDVKFFHDFPVFPKGEKDKDEIKMYFMRLLKFLRTNALKYLDMFSESDGQEPEDHTMPPTNKKDDLPWDDEIPMGDENDSDKLPF